MQKSQMSKMQQEHRSNVTAQLVNSGWQLKNVEAYDADFFLDAELSARKRNTDCILELNLSYEDEYVSIAVASFKHGRAEYVVYFQDLPQATAAVSELVNSSDTLTVNNSIYLAERLCDLFPENVYFFDGDKKELLNKKNINEIFAASQ
jgi:hypothetical protein